MWVPRPPHSRFYAATRLPENPPHSPRSRLVSAFFLRPRTSRCRIERTRDAFFSAKAGEHRTVCSIMLIHVNTPGESEPLFLTTFRIFACRRRKNFVVPVSLSPGRHTRGHFESRRAHRGRFLVFCHSEIGEEREERLSLLADFLDFFGHNQPHIGR